MEEVKPTSFAAVVRETAADVSKDQHKLASDVSQDAGKGALAPEPAGVEAHTTQSAKDTVPPAVEDRTVEEPQPVKATTHDTTAAQQAELLPTPLKEDDIKDLNQQHIEEMERRAEMYAQAAAERERKAAPEVEASKDLYDVPMADKPSMPAAPEEVNFFRVQGASGQQSDLPHHQANVTANDSDKLAQDQLAALKIGQPAETAAAPKLEQTAQESAPVKVSGEQVVSELTSSNKEGAVATPMSHALSAGPSAPAEHMDVPAGGVAPSPDTARPAGTPITTEPHQEQEQQEGEAKGVKHVVEVVGGAVGDALKTVFAPVGAAVESVIGKTGGSTEGEADQKPSSEQ